MKQIISALIAGLLFGAGLTISTMVDPARVLGFLDVFGNWDPTLVFVMAGGLSVYLPVYYMYVKPRQKTVFGEPCYIPKNTKVDRKLIIGASLFGVGWGLSGICPGPAIVNLSGGLSGILMFVFTMLVGMILASLISRKLS